MNGVSPMSDMDVIHYGPVYEPWPPLGDSLAACRPGPHVGALTTNKSWVTCEACKQTEAYRDGR